MSNKKKKLLLQFRPLSRVWLAMQFEWLKDYAIFFEQLKKQLGVEE